MTGKYLKKRFIQAAKWAADRVYVTRRWFARKAVKSRNFTVISNNCWAGKVYQYFDMPYLSPTVGLYFFADDYIKFISDLHHYIDSELKFIKPNESKYYDILMERNQLSVPIGIIDDVEIVFLHYADESEAKEKWERRCKRINWDNVFIKFSPMNKWNESHLTRFRKMTFENKILLTASRKNMSKNEFYWSGPHDGNEIILDTIPFPGNISVISIFSRPPIGYPKNGLSC